MTDKKILIIDDESSDRKAMAIALEKDGYHAFLFAETDQDGIEKARSFKPDVILIDVVLRGVDGFDVCKTIRAIEVVQSKIVMITGHLDAIEVAKARTSGADEIIEKIPGFTNIGKTIASVIKK